MPVNFCLTFLFALIKRRVNGKISPIRNTFYILKITQSTFFLFVKVL